MNDKVLDTIKKFNMIKSGDTIVVGVSGGPDSMSLLHFFLSFKNFFKIKIVVAHVNHCLRGEESERDEFFVKRFCDEHELDFKLLKVDVREKSKKYSMGLEQCGREIRYKFFYDLAKDASYKIATAHTLSDSIETVILNLVRGSGLKGLCGIPPTRNKIIRPLISVTRDEIEKYCVENKVDYIIDGSNLDRDYNRNKIRLDVIPVLKEINPALNVAVSRLMETVNMENEFIEKNVLPYCDGKISRIKSLDPAVKTRVILEVVRKKSGVKLEKNHVDLILKMIDLGKGKVNIPGNFFVTIKNGFLSVDSKVYNSNSEKNSHWEVEFGLKPLKTYDGSSLSMELIPLDKDSNCENFVNILKSEKKQFNNLLDYDTISKTAVFRNRRPEDFFISKNNSVKKKLKKFFNEIKFPVEKRYSVTMLANGNEVLWIDGVGVSDKCKVTERTQNVLKINVERG